jgi:hypothetical protein
MEYKSLAKLFFQLIVIGNILTSCGYLDNDSMEYRKYIYDKFVVIKRENNRHYQLAYQTKSDSYDILVEACNEIYLDSTKRSIYIHERFGVTELYYKVKIIKTGAISSTDAMTLSEVDFNTFRGLVSNVERVFSLDDGSH